MKIDKKKYYYDKAAATRPEKFFERYLTLVNEDGEEKPFKLEPFQSELTRAAMGWKHKNEKDNPLKHRVNWFEVPKGNGKTPLMAGLAAYFAIDGIQKGEIYIVAGDKEQARICHNDCKDMIENSPKLSPAFEIYRDSIIHKRTKSQIKVISSEDYSKHGYRPFIVIFDEFHVQRSRKLYDTLKLGLKKKRNSQIWIITTSGESNTFYEEMHDYAVKVRDGVLIDDSMLVIIHAADPEADIYDEKTWIAANPGWGTIIDPFNFRTFAEGELKIPSSINSFKQLHLNIITGATQAWIPQEEWDKCNKGPIDLESLKGRACYGGLDLATVRDTSSLVLLFPSDDETFDVLAWFWIPKKTAMKRTVTQNINFMAWIEAGHVIAIPGGAMTVQEMLPSILKVLDQFEVNSIAYDRALAAHVVAGLTDQGYEMNPYGQGYLSMSPAAKELEKLIIGEKINHAGTPVLRWQMSNVVIDTDPAGNIKPTKKKAKDKIDGAVALIMALGEYITAMADGDDSLPDDYKFTIL